MLNDQTKQGQEIKTFKDKILTDEKIIQKKQKITVTINRVPKIKIDDN